jgi:hypothetical protein
MRLYAQQVVETIIEVARTLDPANHDPRSALATAAMAVLDRAMREEREALERKHQREREHSAQWIAQSLGRLPSKVKGRVETAAVETAPATIPNPDYVPRSRRNGNGLDHDRVS